MAQFEIAYKITVFGNEGFYNPGNGEAETYEGLDRSQNPDNPIWPIIDRIKAAIPCISIAEMNRALAANAQVQAAVKNFYIARYWDVLHLNDITDQQVANNLFDCSINPCIESAARVMQEAVNTIKPGALVVDGKAGPLTVAAVNGIDAEMVFNAINAIRKANYEKRVQLSPKMAPWLRVWLNRLVAYQNYLK